MNHSRLNLVNSGSRIGESIHHLSHPGGCFIFRPLESTKCAVDCTLNCTNFVQFASSQFRTKKRTKKICAYEIRTHTVCFGRKTYEREAGFPQNVDSTQHNVHPSAQNRNSNSGLQNVTSMSQTKFCDFEVTKCPHVCAKCEVDFRFQEKGSRLPSKCAVDCTNWNGSQFREPSES